jgi:hypothetical protein
LTKQLEHEIEAQKKQIEKLSPQIDANIVKRTEARNAFQTQLKSIRALREAQTAASKELDLVKSKQAKMESEFEEKKKKLDAARKDLKSKNPDSIDAQVAQIEYTMTHTSLSLKEEKAYMAEIKELKASKALFAEYNQAKAAVDGADNTHIGSLRDLRRAKTKEFIAAKEEVAKLNDTVTAARKAEEDANATVVNLLAAKKFAQDQVSKLLDQIRAARQAHREQERAFNDYNEYVLYQKRVAAREARKAREEARAAEEAAYAAESAEAEAEAEEEDVWAPEKELCAQLLVYLNRLLPAVKEEVAVQEGGLDMDRRTETEEDNGRSLATMLGRKKTDEDVDSILGGVGKKKVKAPKKVDAPKVKKTNLTHTPNVFEQFDLIDLLPPFDVPSIAGTITAVQEKLDFFNTNPDKSLKAELKQKREQAAKDAAAALKKANKKTSAVVVPAAAAPVAEESRCVV